MPISLSVPSPGVQLAICLPDKAKPDHLYLVSLKGGGQGPIVMARRMGQDMQLGPLPENFDVNTIEHLAELPPLQRIEVEGLLIETNPPVLRAIQLIGQHAATHNVVLHF
jgi:hypothetical protein